MITTKKQPKPKNKIGIIFVSNSTNENVVNMTQNAITTARQYTDKYNLKIIVAESNEGQKEYEGAEIFHHKVEPFNYNKILNLSRKKLKDYDFILFCNNDLVFTENWLDNLLENTNLCLSPKDTNSDKQRNIQEDESGYSVATHFSGWCFGLRKEALELIGDFNEDYQFWFSDNVVADQLQKVGIIPTLVVKSVVKHFGSQTLKSLAQDEKYKFTYADVDRYEENSGEQTDILLKNIGRTREGRILANKMLPKI